MDSGNNTELEVLLQQLHDVSLQDDKMDLSGSNETHIEQPKLETETKTPEMDKVVLDVEQPKIITEKEKYVQSRLNLTNPKEQKHLALKLQPGYMEKEAGITAEQKLANFKKELEAEYEEIKDLQSQTAFLIQEAVAQNFVSEKEKPWIWESEDSQARVDREKSKNEARLKRYIETNQDDILLKALKQEIRLELQDKPEKIQKLDNKEKAQAFVQPIANKRISDTTQALKALSKDREYTRYYAKPPVQPKKNITTDFPDLEAAIGVHFRYPLLQKELNKPIASNNMDASEKQKRQELIEKNQLRSDQASQINKDVTDGRVLHGSVKKFKPVI